MSGPEHQHFIPRSYINKFAMSKDDKHFIAALKKGDARIITLSTRDICVERNLYTLPQGAGENKFALEHFYADRFDGKFTEIYNVLVDEKVTEVDREMKLKIISTALSLYFRTPKFLNQENKMLEELVRKHDAASTDDTFEVSYAGERLKIGKHEVESILKELKEHNRFRFLSQHLVNFERFVKSKLNDIIYVYHIVDDSEFITCDNPVIIRPPIDLRNIGKLENYAHKEIDPFDSGNMIHLPLDSKTILTFLPNPDNDPNFKVLRLKKKRIDVILYNSDIERVAERWLMGSEPGLAEHMADQKKFNDEEPEAVMAMEAYKEKAIQLMEIMELIEKKGMDHDDVQARAMVMAKLDSVKEDPNFDKLFRAIQRAGLIKEMKERHKRR